MEIRPLIQQDYTEWVKLYELYARHYEFNLTEESLAVSWGWLTNKLHPCRGIVAIVEKKLSGLAHYREMPSLLDHRHWFDC